MMPMNLQPTSAGAPPPPPPPPPPAAFFSPAKTPVVLRTPIKRAEEPAAPSATPVDIAKLIKQSGGMASLRKTNVPRSPGGTPMRAVKRSRLDDETDAIAQALKAKFALLKRLMDGADDDNDDEDSEDDSDGSSSSSGSAEGEEEEEEDDESSDDGEEEETEEQDDCAEPAAKMPRL
jgi:hypothetical protein